MRLCRANVIKISTKKRNRFSRYRTTYVSTGSLISFELRRIKRFHRAESSSRFPFQQGSGNSLAPMKLRLAQESPACHDIRWTSSIFISEGSFVICLGRIVRLALVPWPTTPLIPLSRRHEVRRTLDTLSPRSLYANLCHSWNRTGLFLMSSLIAARTIVFAGISGRFTAGGVSSAKRHGHDMRNRPRRPLATVLEKETGTHSRRTVSVKNFMHGTAISRGRSVRMHSKSLCITTYVTSERGQLAK